MPRLMSVAFTEQAVVERRKTVTRRKGWIHAKPGERLTLCRKVMGRKAGEPLVRLVDVEIVDIRREPLSAITQEDVALEGFPDMDRVDFINRFFVEAQGIYGDDEVTRIEWRYLEPEMDDTAVTSVWCQDNKHERCKGPDGCTCDCHEGEA